MDESVREVSNLIMIPANWLLSNAGGIISAILVLVFGWYLARTASRLVERIMPRAYGVDKNFVPLVSQVARYGILAFAMITALSLVGVASTSIYAALAAAGLAIALALQNTLANIAAGIMLILLRPIAIGEFITGDGVAGVVVEIGLFGTRLRSTSGLFIFTPNQKLWASAITNHSREPRRRIDVNVSVPDTLNIAQARKILLRVATSDKRVLIDPPPNVHVDSFTGTTVAMQLRAWAATPNYLSTLYALTENSKIALTREMNAQSEYQISVGPDPNVPNPETK